MTLDILYQCLPREHEEKKYAKVKLGLHTLYNDFLPGRATKRGGGLNRCATKEKRTFFFNVRSKIPMATKPSGLSGRATKKRTFFLWLPQVYL